MNLNGRLKKLESKGQSKRRHIIVVHSDETREEALFQYFNFYKDSVGEQYDFWITNIPKPLPLPEEFRRKPVAN